MNAMKLRDKTALKHCLWLFAFINVSLVSFFLFSAHAQNTSRLGLINLRVVGDESRLRFISVFDKKPTYNLQYFNLPKRLVINLPTVDFSEQKQKPTPVGMLSSIRYGLVSQNSSRIILTINTSFSVENQQVEQLDDGFWQVIVDLKKDSEQTFDNLLKRQNTQNFSSIDVSKNNEKSPFRVVIDAGHGGIDSGAQGVTGILEKDVTLAFARALREELEKNTLIDVFLTRDSDVFLRLNERVEKAREYCADLFISIHADSINTQSLRGATVYTISDQASDNVARVLAESENKTDLLDGLPADKFPEISDILIDLTRRETHAFSVSFADQLVQNLSQNNIKLIKNPHRYAGFQVLKAHDIPSVLVELGYLSNKHDEKLISDPAWRFKMAGTIAQSVIEFAQYRIGSDYTK
ncbi:N-acetylmuramoyl-L-alanine amidase [Bartonella tamiae]|uniref:N-acetylmuramoyl-L-alanine amidase n=1 Tax=Bartonella tamiae Th239 TaxID=1094558 RepID=J1JWE6_9HYPH|nr:N-acetylmuramoyl-L-alanine amidase [Bartonella tamiae]EJF88895.1 hypothetical protein ME5_01446 [Bartonella tamiae Th239]EJF94855.1 hypothetical protein MEG_00436 [Bartonella tamiae Th307]